MLKILVPEMAGISAIAADQFAALWQQVTGQRLEVTEKDDPNCDLIVLGSDACNAFTHAKSLKKSLNSFPLLREQMAII